VTDELDTIRAGLRELRLAHAADVIEEEIARATKERASYTTLVARLVERERGRRRDLAYGRRLKAAGFPETRSLDNYDFTFPKKIDARLVRELATLGFMKANEAVWIAGPSGTGKSHIAIALGMRALAEGSTVLYRTMSKIARDLLASVADHTEERRLRFYERPDLLIVEDLAFANTTPENMPLIFELFHRRYEHLPIIVTSNLDGDDAENTFGQRAMAAAVLDRVLHHAHLVTIDGPSWRAEHRLGKRKSG